MGLFQSNSSEERTIPDTPEKNNEVKVEIIEDSDTFVLDANLAKREVGDYVSTVKDIIDMTIKNEKEEAEEELKKKEDVEKNDTNYKPNPDVEFKVKNIKNFHMCSENYNKQIYNFGHCPMLYGLYNCYGSHEPISLSPDDFWLMIIQSFSIYVLRNSEKVKNLFVNFEGKKTLSILLNGYMKTITKERYEDCFKVFNKQIGEFVGNELVDTLQANFSTSTPTEKAVSQIGIMTALQNYFEYVIYTIGCGFPSITLRGTLEDYEKILEKMKFLEKFGLGWWYELLKPIITKIVETKKFLEENKKENIDVEFWKQMIKKETAVKEVEKGSAIEKYKTDFISGWIINFFPFGKKGNRRDRQGRFDIPNKLGFLVETDCKEIPGEIQCVPLKIVELDTGNEFDCFLYNGFFGFERDNNNRMKPVIGWFLAE